MPHARVCKADSDENVDHGRGRNRNGPGEELVSVFFTRCILAFGFFAIWLPLCKWLVERGSRELLTELELVARIHPAWPLQPSDGHKRRFPSDRTIEPVAPLRRWRAARPIRLPSRRSPHRACMPRQSYCATPSRRARRCIRSTVGCSPPTTTLCSASPRATICAVVYRRIVPRLGHAQAIGAESAPSASCESRSAIREAAPATSPPQGRS